MRDSDINLKHVINFKIFRQTSTVHYAFIRRLVLAYAFGLQVASFGDGLVFKHAD